MDFPVLMRKRNRLEGYDYSRGGAYYVTICAQFKRCIIGAVVDCDPEPVMRCNDLGHLVNACIRGIPEHYPTVRIARHCVMPNHVHMLLYFDTERKNPSLSTVINQFKGFVTKTAGHPVWQKGYYEHVVRSETDFRQIGEYIEHNAAKWKTDENYVISVQKI